MQEMTIESLKQKIENQARLIKELTIENEELYHQYNHLIIRNGKMLKRIDDFQKIINDLHIRIEEMQLINGNMMGINDKLRNRDIWPVPQHSVQMPPVSYPEGKDLSNEADDSHDMEELMDRWRNFPGQVAQNEPNLRKQLLMLVQLYNTPTLRAADLFNRAGVGGVTGARYVSTLKKFGLICFTGARKKGHYEITKKGKEFIENTITYSSGSPVQPFNPVRAKSVESAVEFQMNVWDQNDL